MVLNLGLIEPQRFGESVSGIWWQEILSNKSNKNKIHDTHFIFPTTTGSMNACMELVGSVPPRRLRTTDLSLTITS